MSGVEAAEIVPDAKNWTWVLERACPECGFDTTAVSVSDLPALIRANAAQWPSVLAHPQATVRPQPTTWSPLEYAAHVRDVYRLFAVRLHLMLNEEDPAFENWDQDATAVAERYQEQDPPRVAEELVSAGEALAEAFARVVPEQYGRTGRRSDGSRFTVETLGRYMIHDPVHHLWDVTGVEASVQPKRG